MSSDRSQNVQTSPNQMKRREYHARRKRAQNLFLVQLAINVLFFIFSAVILYNFNKYEILPSKYRLLITGILIIANVYFAIALLKGLKHSGVRQIGLSVGALMLVFSLGITIYLNQGVAALNKVSELAEEDVAVKETVMSVRVLTTSPIHSLEDLAGKKLLAPYSTDQTNLDNFYTAFKKDNDTDILVTDVESYLSAAEQLYDHLGQAMILNEDQLSIILEKFPDFNDKTRVVTTSKLETEELMNIKKVDTANEPFVIYISGIDTYGSIGASSRSDVNIVAAVNPKTKTVLMVSVPRDMYVRVPDDGNDEMDKLTHAGIYGVQTSVKTIENFLDININYYIKVNFTSVIALVDLIGGVQVDNPYEFTAFEGTTFPAGIQTLSGNQALEYSRERYNLPGGDADRGKNQERVLTGVIHKITGPDVITKFSSLMEIARTSMQTSMSTNDMMKLVNLQIGSGTPWNIISESVTGYGEYGWSSYAAPGYNVYVLIPSDDSVAEAKKHINELLLDGVSSNTATASNPETASSSDTNSTESTQP